MLTSLILLNRTLPFTISLAVIIIMTYIADLQLNIKLFLFLICIVNDINVCDAAWGCLLEKKEILLRCILQ